MSKLPFPTWRKQKGMKEHIDGIKKIANLTNLSPNNKRIICYIV